MQEFVSRYIHKFAIAGVIIGGVTVARTSDITSTSNVCTINL